MTAKQLTNKRMRVTRRGFATIEPFLVSPLILALGVGITLAMRWLLGTTHWLTWLPSVVFAIPFLFFFGFVPAMVIVTELKRRRKIDD